MKNPSIRQYLTLFSYLLSGHPWLKWMWIIGAAILTLGIPVKLIGGTIAGFIVGGTFIILLITINVFFIPSQILSMVSSKQIGLLPGIRKGSFIVFAFLNVLVIAVLSLFVFSKIDFSVSSFAAITLISSSFLIASVLVGQKYPRAQGLIFMCAPIFEHIFHALKNVHPILQAIFTLSVWLAFYRHWMSWMPAKYYPNIFGMSRSQLAQFARQQTVNSDHIFDRFFNFNSSSANTVVGSMLLGRSDGFKPTIALMLLIFALLLTIIFIFIGVSGKAGFRNFFTVGGQANICIMYICMGFSINKNIFRHVHKAWLFFDGSRDSYFLLIERLVLKNMLFLTFPLMLTHALVDYFLLDWRLYSELIGLTAIYGFILIAINLYVTLFVYHKGKGDLRWGIWVNNIFFMIAMIPLIAGNVLWVEKKSAIITLAIYFIAFTILLILMLRHRLKRDWSSVDLMRVKS